MRLLASWIIFRGNRQLAVMVDNSFRRMCSRKALRRLACEGRRWASSQGESLRLQSCLWLRSQAHNSTSVCIQRFRLYTARLVQMLRTCCWPVPHTSLTIVEVLFDGGAIGEGFENRDDALLGIGTEERVPAMIFLDQHNANHTASGAIGGQEGLVGLGDHVAIQRDNRRFAIHAAVRPAWRERVLFLPYLRGRPRARRWPRPSFGGRSRRAASLRKRPTTTSLGIFNTRRRNGRLV